jgi:hypothetical protein
MQQASTSATQPFERLLAHLAILEPVFVGGRLVAAILTDVAKARKTYSADHSG